MQKRRTVERLGGVGRLMLWAGLAATPSLAQPVLENQILTPTPATSEDAFGISVAMSGGTAIIGAARYNGVVSDTGAAFIRAPGAGGAEIDKLIASDGVPHDRFGTAVSLDIDAGVAIVGAPFSDPAGSSSGSAYIYRYNGMSWVQEVKLTAFDGAASDQFGAAVAIQGDVALVGSPQDDNDLSNAGAVYAYRFDGAQWSLESKITEAAPSAGAQMGASISLVGGTAVIGAPFQGGPGAAHVYQVAPVAGGYTWTKAATLTPGSPESGQEFGRSVGFDGERAIVGSPLDDLEISGGGSVFNAGSATIFFFDGLGWHEEAVLNRAADADPADYFGYSVDLWGSRAIVGAYNSDDPIAGMDTGSAYTFLKDGGGWAPEAELAPSTRAPGSFFGYAVAAKETAFVGAYGHVPANASGGRWGATYVYELGPAQPADSDGDGLTDSDEITVHGTDPLLADTDNDILGDGDEVGLYETNPLDDDTDGDGLGDGEEVALQEFGPCPNPVLADTDEDGLNDGLEVLLEPALDPCDADFDNDGLSDGNESLAQTDATDPDSDDDGLLDGTEVDMAQGGSCPSPLAFDSDGDSLADGAEASAGTSPCSADSDGDGASDAMDPTPNEPGVSSGVIEEWLRFTSDGVQQTDLSLFDAPNDNAARGRRLVMTIQLRLAANATSRGRFELAIFQLDLLRRLVDEESWPRDWMVTSPEKAQLLGDIDMTIGWLEYELD